MKQTIKGFVYYVKYDFNNKPHLEWSKSSTMGEKDTDWTKVGPHNFTIECPDDFDPRPQQIAALDEQITAVRAEFSKRIMELQDQKSRLLALENAS